MSKVHATVDRKKKRMTTKAVSASPRASVVVIQRVDNPDELMSRASSGLIRFERGRRRRRLLRRLMLLAVLVLAVFGAVLSGVEFFDGFRLMQLWKTVESP